MAVRLTVTTDLTRLRRVRKIVADEILRADPAGPLRKVFKQWAARARSFLQERFDDYSKGGGDWLPLAQSTIEGRRGGTSKNKKRSSLARLKGGGLGRAMRKGSPVVVSILRDKGQLFAALSPAFVGAPGAVEEDVPFGVRIGFGGSAKHEDSDVTIADIASFHQEGGARLPQRMLIVPPSESVQEMMAGDLRRALDDVISS